MVFKSGPHFNAVKEQNRLNFDSFGLRWDIETKSRHLQSKVLGWIAWGGYGNVACSYICGADPNLIQQVQDMLSDCARVSLNREDWRSYIEKLTPEELSVQYYLDVGKVFDRHNGARPDVWLQANLVLIADHWLRTGTLDQDAIATTLAKDIEGLPAIQGAYSSLDLLPLSAWPEIKMLPALSDEQCLKRKPDAVERIALMLADDPAQLHDPKSPARKRARNYMRGNMSQNWLNQGLAGYAMSWLRTIEWREGQSGLSPREVMLRAYAYMPEVEPPPNIAAEVATLRKLPI